MKTMFLSFRQLLQQIAKDKLLLLISFDPILTGFIFKFGIPFAEKVLINHFGNPEILTPYYLLFDIVLSILTPYIFCFVSAMIILEEIDNKVAQYVFITPVGKSGYLVSRLIFPLIISVLVSVPVVLFFSLTNISITDSIFLSISSSGIGLIVSLIIVAFSSNKVEGITLAKLGAVILLGAPIPFFFHGNRQYIGAFLPSFWVSKLALDCSLSNLMFGISITAVWILLLFKRFLNANRP